MGQAMAQSFLINKGVNDAYTEAEAFFLGGLIMCCDEHHGRDFVYLVRHNSGFVSAKQLSEHRSAISTLANMAGGRVTDLDSRKFDGFAVHFSSRTDSETSLISRANSILEDGEVGVRSALLSGVFDGRASFDRRKGAAATTQFVVDCPRNFEELVSDLVVRLGRQFGIQINTNFSRDRLSGGNPRKTQLRMKSSDAERFFTQVGLVSPAKMERAREMYGAKGLREKDAAALPELYVIDKSIALRSGSGHAAHVTARTTAGKPQGRAVSSHDKIPTPSVKRAANKTPVQQAKRRLSAEERSRIVVGCTVTHKSLGSGMVTALDEKHIKVMLDGKERMFMFPDAFENGFLRL